MVDGTPQNRIPNIVSEGGNQTVLFARQEAARLGHPYVGIGHMLVAVVRAIDSLESPFRKLGIGPTTVISTLEHFSPKTESSPNQRKTLTPRLQKVIQESFEIKRIESTGPIDIATIFRSIMVQQDGTAFDILQNILGNDYPEGVDPLHELKDPKFVDAIRDVELTKYSNRF